MNLVANVTILDVYEASLGSTPAQIRSSPQKLKMRDLVAVLDAHSRLTEPWDKGAVASNEIWPLISHHTYGNRAIFGVAGTDIVSRTLTLLLVHDGLVIADPLETVRRTLVTGRSEAAIEALNHATEQLAEVEALIAAGVLRLTTIRPALHDTNRSAVLKAFGLTPDLRVFTDFLEAAGSLGDFPGALVRTFAPQVQELYRIFGLSIPQPQDILTAERRIKDLAAAVIEVSWQLSVAAENPWCDLAFSGPLEQHLARELVVEGLSTAASAGRHFDTMELGNVPNLDADQLTLADAIAIRQDDTFESFRSTVRVALDQLEVAKQAGIEHSLAIASFEETMWEESRRMSQSTRKAIFKDQVRDASVPAMLGVVTELAVAPMGAVPAAGAAAGIAIATVVWQWLTGRVQPLGQASGVRYLSMLGGNPSSNRDNRSFRR